MGMTLRIFKQLSSSFNFVLNVKDFRSSHHASSRVDRQKKSFSIARSIRGAPRKISCVLHTIRGKTYEEALMIMEYMPFRATKPILKCLLSAASYAKNNLELKKNTLYVQTAYCNTGPVMRRFRFRAQGKGYKIK